MTVTDTELLTSAQVAKHFKVSEYTIRRWLKAKRLRAVKLPGGQWRIPADALEDAAVAS